MMAEVDKRLYQSYVTSLRASIESIVSKTEQIRGPTSAMLDYGVDTGLLQG
jgi:hypothetical protein